MSLVDQTSSSSTIATDVLKSAVCGILLEHGFSSSTDKAVGVLVGLLEGCKYCFNYDTSKVVLG